MKLLVYEHVSGGGFADQPIPGDIFSEGFAMLRTLTCDLETAGHRVTVPLDARLKPYIFLLEAEQILESGGALLKTFKDAAENAEAAYIIAPESDGTLASLIEAVEESGLISLNCTVEAVKAAADKAEAYRRLKQAGLRVPETVEVDVAETPARLRQMAKDLGFPVVFKPKSGVSCTGISLVRKVEEMPEALKKLKREGRSRSFLLQKYIRGVSASVSLIAADKEASALTLNQQRVKLASPREDSGYMGGLVPLEHPLNSEAFTAAVKAISLFRGLRGYVGVDMVLAENGVYIMEVNPRLTTSYVGLRRVAGFNPAQAMVNAVLRGSVPGNCSPCGFAAFMKVKASGPYRLSQAERIRGVEVLTPPFGESAFAFIAAYGASPHMAWNRLYMAWRRLEKHNRIGEKAA